MESGELPSGYGVTIDELVGDTFDEGEEIVIGRARKSYPIMLPSQVWKPRTELWAQGLYVMTTVLSVSL